MTCTCPIAKDEQPENYIKIFRGDDTNFNNSQWLKILLETDIDLAGFQGVFSLFGYSYTGAINAEEKSLEIEIPASDTAKFPIGPADGVFRLEDTQNRFKTVSNTIPFFITNTVFTQQEQNITLPVPPDYPISVKVQIPGGDVPPAGTSDYNELENLPTFNGTQWAGTQTFQSANIAPLSGLNALEQVVNQKPSAVDVQNAVNGLQEQINTNKNDLAGLGDQVSEIEAKMPQEASDTNQLADKNYIQNNFYTKAQTDEKISASGAGGADVDLTGYYNENNLLGGKDIEIVEVLPEGGIDEHTVACWHFDGTLSDVVHDITLGNGDLPIDNLNYKFGTGSLKQLERASYWGRWDYKANISVARLTTGKPLTVDFWLQLNQPDYALSYRGETTEYAGFNRNDEKPFGLKWLWNTNTKKVKFGDYLDTDNWSAEISLSSYGEWHHVAYTYNADTKISKIYFDGKLIKTTQLTLAANFTLNYFNFYRQEVNYQPQNNIDEARISDIIRYTEDFVPPTKAYSVAEPTGKKQINFTGVIPEIDTSALISKTEKGAADGVAPLGADRKIPAEYLPLQSITVSDEKHGIRADYALKHGIIECPQGLIDFSVNNKDITMNPGIVLQLAGAETQTTLASQERYTVQETGKITLFLARTQSSSGTIQIGFLEAADVFWQEEEPTNGTAAYLAWYNPNLGKWQFKNSDTGNVWREAVATPMADINASTTGIISVNYFGYSVNDARNCASLTDIESLEEKYALLLQRIEALENK